MTAALISLVIAIFIILIVAGIIWYAIGLITVIPAQFRQLLQALIVALAALVIILRALPLMGLG